MTRKILFHIGQLVHHLRFAYRGVVVDVDPEFMHTDEWYEAMARSRPPKDEPWYHVLVDRAIHQTYVAQCNLEADESDEQISHPGLGQFFERFEHGRYWPKTE